MAFATLSRIYCSGWLVCLLFAPVQGYPVCLQWALLINGGRGKAQPVCGSFLLCSISQKHSSPCQPAMEKSEVITYKELKLSVDNVEKCSLQPPSVLFILDFFFFIFKGGFFGVLLFLVNSAVVLVHYQPVSIWETHMSSTSSDVDVAFRRTARECVSSLYKSLSPPSRNGNVYTDGHICRTINSTLDI